MAVAMEIYGNAATFNVENVLKQNIVGSEYYRNDCTRLLSWSEVIDEIYYNVSDVEPWMSGNARGASSAFCLMYRLFTLKLTEQEVRETVNHPDSPYIRAVGFLFLRYVCNPRDLWSWCEPYVEDPEEFAPGADGKVVTMGAFLRDILLEQYYFETIFPRIPKKVSDGIMEYLKQHGLPAAARGNGGAGGPDRRGLDEPNRRPASVKASLSVAFGQRAPNRAGAREEGRGRDPSAKELSRDRLLPAAAAPSQARARPSPPPSPRPGRRRSRERSGERGHSDRYREPPPPRPYRSRSRSPRSKSRDHHHPHHPYHRSRPHDAFSRDRSRDGHRYGRHGGGGAARGSRSPVRRRSRSRERGSRERRSRDDSREGYVHNTRDVRDVFREEAGSRRVLDDNMLKSRYG